MATGDARPSSLDFLAGGGEMGGLMRAHDWSGTPLGSPEGWPQSLRSAVSIMLNSRYPIALYWGESLSLLYNDAWSPIPGSKHPWALGRPGHDVWPEIWDTIGPLYASVLATGEGVWQEDQLLPMLRHGYVEECYFNFTFSPVRGENGGIDGIFNAVVETTERVLSERRLRTLGRMGERADPGLSDEDACRWAAAILADNKADFPFVLVYLRQGELAYLAAFEGLDPGSVLAPAVLPVDEIKKEFWSSDDIDHYAAARTVAIPTAIGVQGTVWPEPVVQARVTPINAAGETRPGALLVVGVNPRRALDATYCSFIEGAAGHLGNALATAKAYADERHRNDALAEIDRAKTAFFSNISHEFRTPLTLMLGPMEDALAESASLPASQRERLDVVHRNALRLLRLVNALLDFSRIEAGRVEVTYQPTDLAALTADLVSSFRSATEKAGLGLIVDTPKLSQPVYVDRDMWETIVLNLISNAFKFTLKGEIRIELREQHGKARLTVQDTGTGIPEAELPKLFDRFHRVERAAGRSFEGSGIGLALVQELVKQHGGEVSVESAIDQGSTFTVTIPLGTAHLAIERVKDSMQAPSTGLRAHTFAEEALRWLPKAAGDQLPDFGVIGDMPAVSTDLSGKPAEHSRIVVADDNADLRLYICRLLTEHGYEVDAVPNGAEALASARMQRPDLLITDVMMPVLDGFTLLREVRDDAALRDLPVLMLSARAGEEARVEGLNAGADDYLTKPFSSREMIARVAGNIQLARMRRDAAAVLSESEARFRNMADHAPVMMWVTEPDGTCTYLNRSWYEFTGQEPHGGEGFGWLDAIHPDDLKIAQQAFISANGEHQNYRAEFRLRRSDGEYRWVIDAASPRFAPNGEFLGYIGSVIDIDDRRDMEDALRAGEERLRLATESAAIGTWDFDPVKGVLRWDERCKALFGLTPEAEVDYDTFLSGVHAEDRAASDAAVQQALAPEGSPDFAVEYRTLGLEDGIERWIGARGRAFFDNAQGQPRATRFVGTVIDITASKRAEELLERRVANAVAEKKLLADIVEGTDAFVQVADLEFRWLAINKASANEFERIYGVRPKVGQSMLDALDDRPEDREAIRAVWARALAGEEFTEIGEFGDPGRDRRHYEMKYNILRDARGERIGAYQFVYDVTQRITEQRRLADTEEALRQSQKMEAMGSLTGGVAHDFNNLLTPIVGALDMLQRKGLGGEREQRLIAGATQSAERARVLVQRLLAFARRQPLQAVAVDIGELVNGMAELVASTTGPQIKVVVDVERALPPAKADPNQLEMAVLNLAVNARDAMPDGGTLRLSVEAATVGRQHRSKLRPGRYLHLSVADTGEGMDEATAARAVEPFFSTKGVGKGTGLGLSMVHGLASQLGGALTIRSTPQVGTNIELWLPQGEEAPLASSLREEEIAPAQGRGTVLLVDDEELVRLSTADMLIEFGYDVVEAASAEEALRLLDRGLNPNIVITDHLMPGMSGTEFARLLLAERPSLKVLVVSGYADTDGIAPDLPRLTKPFRNMELAASLTALN